MLGIKFVNRVSEQVEHQKLQEQSMYASNFTLASVFHFSSFSCCAFYTSYTTLTEREKDSKRVQAWLNRKNKKLKKRPKFNLRLYAARNAATNMHEVKVGGMRNPYDLQVSRNKVAVTHFRCLAV